MKIVSWYDVVRLIRTLLPNMKGRLDKESSAPLILAPQKESGESHSSSMYQLLWAPKPFLH
jgi:hypothetical protein